MPLSNAMRVATLLPLGGRVRPLGSGVIFRGRSSVLGVPAPYGTMARMARTRPNPPALHLFVVLAAVLVPVLAIMAFFTRIPEPPINKMDPAPIIAQAQAESPYAVAAPTHLPDGWICTRARWTPSGAPALGGTPALGHVFALGYLSPSQMYVAVDQTDGPGSALVASAVGKPSEDGTSVVAGKTWTRYASGERATKALVSTDGGATTVVSGDLDYPALEAFAGALEFKRG